MEQYILTIVKNRGGETPTTEQLEKQIQQFFYESEVYLKKIGN